ncbi:MAG: hypothetical protein HYT12_00050 [Candidatus Liptonbacteria bacterium]|nr:hypothetical protein [Candidatus Liptonbacteria bacterium]
MVNAWFVMSVAYVIFTGFCIWLDFVLARQCSSELIAIKQKYAKEEDLKERLALIASELKFSVLFSLQHVVLMTLPPLLARAGMQYYIVSPIFIHTAILSAFAIFPCTFIFWGYAFLYPCWVVGKAK